MGGSKKVCCLQLRSMWTVIAAGSLALFCRPLLAEQLVLNLVPQSSSLSGLGFIPALAVNTVAQDPNGASVTTTYSGTITVEVDNLMSPTSIAFVAANAVAANSGDWLPALGGGSEGDPNIEGDADPGTPAPANYGFFLDAGDIGSLYAASRNTILSLNDAATPMTAGQFDPFGISAIVVQGLYEANVNSPVFGDDAGSDDITNEVGANCTDMAGSVNRCGTAMGSYSVAGDLVTLNLPLDFILGEGDDVEVTFTGSFVATASLAPPQLFGDYNENGVVDAADYVVWRDNVGTTNMLPNDDIGGEIGEDHYSQWKQNFGNGASGAGLGAALVPEPASALLVVMGLVGLGLGRRRRGR